MAVTEKIPIIVGVTGHRNIVEEDKPAIKALVKESLQDVQALCKAAEKNGEHTPVVMLNAFAQGADMLCAEAAFELGIDVYALLPCPEDEYRESFDDDADKAKLHDYLAKTKRTILAPDIEQNKEWFKGQAQMDEDSYRYRQLGIYMAEHSHILLALWDGKPPKVQYGCGTVEVIHFALEHSYLDKGNFFRPCTVTDSAVIWIKSRREGAGDEADIRKQWLAPPSETGKTQGAYEAYDTPPAYLTEIIAQTVDYNRTEFAIPDNKVKLWKDADALDDYHKGLRYHYAKADDLSYSQNQRPYDKVLLALAILGTLVALTFLIYDDAALPFMIFPCTILLGAIVVLCRIGSKKAFHKDYIKFRAFAEALRIQFYLSACLGEEEPLTNVCDLYSWTQKVDMIWIENAIQALAVLHESRPLALPTDEIVDVWIGKNQKPEGQLSYHTRKKPANQKKAAVYERLSSVFQAFTIALYAAIFILEIVALVCKLRHTGCFWASDFFKTALSWRNVGAIFLGFFTAGSLLLSSYLGKLSYDRKAEDNEKMRLFYTAAVSRWQQVRDRDADAIKKFVTEIAREEIVENGIWCSYVAENRLEINI